MELYWILRLPHLHNLCIGTGVLLGIVSTTLLLIPPLLYDAYIPRHSKELMPFYLGLIASLLFFVIGAFIPTKTDIALMMGWDALRSDNVKEIVQILKQKGM